jgi:hypothetical protein
MGVVEIDKAPGVLCRHCGQGCMIHADRPASCASFQCMWLRDNLAAALRPDRSSVVLVAPDDDESVVAKVNDPADCEAPLMKAYLRTVVESGKVVFVAKGDVPLAVLFSGSAMAKRAGPLGDWIERIKGMNFL